MSESWLFNPLGMFWLQDGESDPDTWMSLFERSALFGNTSWHMQQYDYNVRSYSLVSDSHKGICLVVRSPVVSHPGLLVSIKMKQRRL